ncbi:palmitoyl-protein thioesterase [Emydomyces testavorans]|uniref:Palmitoyl-protein thioesterase 1 n=1 Tax=Emydomyces testavorans TaxID=2070801 RepID=A0AAF0DH01_9EURO|nr:palmitoyl-protein thioesterase [Emydomyces testavorans]
MRIRIFPLLPLLLPALSFPLSTASTSKLTPLPLVVWHGLGDDFARDGLKQVSRLAEEINPGTYVHVIHVGATPEEDRQATFLGNVTTQLAAVCEQLASDPILSTAPAINALGFSQGGQFLRGYVERCNNPPVRNLVTFGSQHNGIAKFQACAARGDWVCRGAEALLQFGAWSELVQSRFVPAQYFRDPEELNEYLQHSNFLADINNERAVKNMQYKRNLIALNKFVMFMFRDDGMVVPKQTAHFAEVNMTSGEVTPLREREVYREDWLGLKVLDEAGKLEFLTVPGEHMQISEDLLKMTFERYFGPVEVDEASNPGLVLQTQWSNMAV